MEPLSDATKRQRSSELYASPIFTAPLTVDGLTVDGLTVDGPINGYMFLPWGRQHLVPTLAHGDIVVMELSELLTHFGINAVASSTSSQTKNVASTSNTTAEATMNFEQF